MAISINIDNILSFFVNKPTSLRDSGSLALRLNLDNRLNVLSKTRQYLHSKGTAQDIAYSGI
jgi:hypothetical protein